MGRGRGGKEAHSVEKHDEVKDLLGGGLSIETEKLTRITLPQIEQGGNWLIIASAQSPR